jgi:para-nitrobenzyl esterase
MVDTERVTTALGQIEGLAGDGLLTFRGIPYASAPRFGLAEPVAPWTGVLDATQYGPIAPQAPSRLRVAMGDPSPRVMSEDCLNLTVWTPALEGKRPVLVWLHGGAWTSGAGSLDWYDGAILAREGGIVVVGVNYRLGALGYGRHPVMSRGNLGTLDQAAALAWVHAHIAAFGGDPAQVTVAGQSAGGSCIGRLILDPAARQLFHRVILQSGSFGRTPLDAAGAEAIGAEFLQEIGVDPAAADAHAQLLALPTEAFITAQSSLARKRARFGDTNPPFMPSLDTPMTEAGLIDAIATAAVGLDVMIGATQDECHAFFAADPSVQNPDPAAVEALFLKARGGAHSMAWYRARRPGGSTMDLIADLGTNNTFLWPSMQLADAAARHGVAVHAYLFTWAAPGNKFRSCHCIELPFLFGQFASWREAPMLVGGDPTGMAALGVALRQSWAAFVHTGSPGRPTLDWPLYAPERRDTMLIGDTWRVVGNPAGLGW